MAHSVVLIRVGAIVCAGIAQERCDMSHEESSNGPTSGIRKIITRFAGIILALTLLGALWSTALTRVSDRSTAVDLLTRAGTDIINPLLTANGSGMGPALYQ